MGGKLKGKRPTRSQKIAMSKKNLNSENWLVLGESIETLHIKNKNSGKIRSIEKVKS